MGDRQQGRRAVVGVFDSGVGGLSVFEALRGRLTGADFAYCSDNANFPYGTKSAEAVEACTRSASERFVERARLDLLVIACNTASTIALPAVRAALKVPVVGVVPAIKPAAAMTRTHTIGLLATPATVSRPYTDELIKSFATACRVLRQGSSVLVELAEAKLRGESVDLAKVKAEIMPMFDASPREQYKVLDTIVLACTHFPLLRAELAAASPWPVQWVDSSEAIAARAAYLLVEAGFEPVGEPGDAKPVAYVTRLDDAAKKLEGALQSLGFLGLKAL